MPPWVRNSSSMHDETIRLSFMATHFGCSLRVDTRRLTLRSESGYRLLTWFQTCVVLWSRSLRFVRIPRRHSIVPLCRTRQVECTGSRFPPLFQLPPLPRVPIHFSFTRQSDRCDMNCSNLYYFDQLILIQKSQNQYLSKA